jgi:hypothetical protein
MSEPIMTDSGVPSNLAGLHGKEERLRAESVAWAGTHEDGRDHLVMVEVSLNRLLHVCGREQSNLRIGNSPSRRWVYAFSTPVSLR